MSDVLFQFEEEAVPPVVAGAAVTLIGLFAVGFAYKLLAVLVL